MMECTLVGSSVCPVKEGAGDGWDDGAALGRPDGAAEGECDSDGLVEGDLETEGANDGDGVGWMASTMFPSLSKDTPKMICSKPSGKSSCSRRNSLKFPKNVRASNPKSSLLIAVKSTSCCSPRKDPRSVLVATVPLGCENKGSSTGQSTHRTHAWKSVSRTHISSSAAYEVWLKSDAFSMNRWYGSSQPPVMEL